jgi:hypothetical protein
MRKMNGTERSQGQDLSPEMQLALLKTGLLPRVPDQEAGNPLEIGSNVLSLASLVRNGGLKYRGS